MPQGDRSTLAAIVETCRVEIHFFIKSLYKPTLDAIG